MIGLHISKYQIYQEHDHSSISKKYGSYNITLSFHRLDNRQVFFENEFVAVLIDGWIFNSNSYETQAEFIVNLYSKYGKEFTSYIEGQFNLFLFDKKNQDPFFVNDIFALRKHFISDGDLSISTDLKFLYSHLNSISFNDKHIKKNLNQNRLIDIEETFINEIKMIIPSSIIDFVSKSVYSTEVFSDKYSFENKRVNPSFFYDNVLKNIKKIHKDSSVLLQLSGGMDSRFLLECFVENKIDVKALIYGTLESDELKIAREVAEVTKTPYAQVEYLAEDYVTNSPSYCLDVAGLDIFVQSAFYKIKKYINKNDYKNFIFDTGIGLNNFIGGTQIEKRFKVPTNNFSKHEFDLKDNDIYTSNYRIFSQLFLRQKFHREFMEDRYSMFSYENYFLMKSIPKNYLKDYKFYSDLADISIKKSRDVNIQATMLPFHQKPSIESTAELKERELKSLKLFNQNKKLEPHNRYYSDFDMWLRSNSSWKSLINKTILSDDSLISKYVSKNIIKDLITKHNNGEKQNMRVLIRLISTELFLSETKKIITRNENNWNSNS